MPPRKSVGSTTSAADDGQTAAGTPAKEPKEREGINIEDLSLPRTMVSRIAKGVLPPNILLSKDVVLALQKSATVFVNYLATQANATTMSNNRRTVPPPAIFEALKELEYEAFIPRVQAELDKFVEIQSTKRNDYRKKQKETKDPTETMETPEQIWDRVEAEVLTKEASAREAGQEGEERGSKRIRVSEGGESAKAGAGDASPSDQLKQQLMDIARKHLGTSDSEDEQDVDEDEGAEIRERGDEEDVEEEEEEEEDDEDEYPDEGHRAESLEMEEADGDEGYGRRKSAYGPGGEGGGGSSSGTDDEEMDD